MNILRSLNGASLALAISVALMSCDSRADRAEDAFNRYQAAAAAEDSFAMRLALMELVAADDNVADYWVELGKVQLQMGDPGAAYGSFVRAQELDRANPSILAVLTQLALRSGNLTKAEEHARQLELLEASNPAVRLTYGYVALRRGDMERAQEQATHLLQTAPFDPSAKVFQAQILSESKKVDEAIALLSEQVRLQPSDQASLSALLALYEIEERWPEAATTARNLLKWAPDNQSVRLRLVASALNAGQNDLARTATTRGFAKANAREIESLLAPWLGVARPGALIENIMSVAAQSQGDRRLAFARFLQSAAQPREVMRLLRGISDTGLTLASANGHALYGAAQVEAGQREEGLSRLDRVLALDSNNADALRARSGVRSAMGRHQGAIEDAQKLVAANRKASAPRLHMAKIFLAAGRTPDAKRTLWDAFHDIPADRSIYEALRLLVQRTDGPLAVERLAQEFKDQRDAEIMGTTA